MFSDTKKAVPSFADVDQLLPVEEEVDARLVTDGLVRLFPESGDVDNRQGLKSLRRVLLRPYDAQRKSNRRCAALSRSVRVDCRVGLLALSTGVLRR